MDLRRLLSHSRVAITLREQLGELLSTDLASTTRPYLIEHPRLLSEEAVSILEQWEHDAASHEDDASAQTLQVYRYLLQIIWHLCICAPLGASAALRPYPELARHFAELDIHNAGDLARMTDGAPAVRQRLAQAALEHISAVDWAVVVLVALQQAGCDLPTWIDENHVLIEYDAELSLNLYEAWAQDAGQLALLGALHEAHKTLRDVREEVAAGRLRLHNMPLLRLVQRLIACESWDDRLAFLNEHPEVLGDAGLDEMVSQLESALVSCLCMEGDPWPLIHDAALLEFMAIAKRQGAHSAVNAMPPMPVQLWALAGMFQAVGPRLLSWAGLQHVMTQRPETAEMLARLLRTVTSTEDGNQPDAVASSPSLPEAAPSSAEMFRFELMGLMQFVCRASAAEALHLLREESNLVFSDSMGRLLKDLYESEEEESPPGQLLTGMYALCGSTDAFDLVSLLGSLANAEVCDLAPNGAKLTMSLGVIAELAGCTMDEERLACIARNRACEEAGTLAVARHVVARGAQALRERLLPAMPLLERAYRIGSLPTLMEHLPEHIDIVETDRAFLACLAAPDLGAMHSLVSEYPFLLSQDVMERIELAIESLKTQQATELLEQVRIRYSWILEVQRSLLTKGRELAEGGSGDSEALEARQLIEVLETRLPAGIWTPVCRADLTAAFFAVLEAWIAQRTTDHDAAARPLRIVQTYAREWQKRFGEPRPEHTSALRQALLELLAASDDDTLYHTIREHPELIKGPAATELLRDWLVTLEGFDRADIAERLGSLVGLLSDSRRVSTELAFVMRAGADKQVVFDALATLRSLLDVDESVCFEDLMLAAANAPDEIMLRCHAVMEDLVRQGGRPDAEETIRHMRIRLLILRLDRALAAGADAYLRLVAAEPLLGEPEAIAEARAAFGHSSPDFLDRHVRIVRYYANPLLRAEREGRLTEGQRRGLENLDDVLKAYLFRSTWRDRFALVMQREELPTETAILRAGMLCAPSDFGASIGIGPSGADPGDQDIDEAIRFLERCMEVAPVIAAREKTEELIGVAAHTLDSGFVRLSARLPAVLAQRLDPTHEDYVEALEEALALPDLDAEDRAEVFARMATYHHAKHEASLDWKDLDAAIECYRLAVQASPNETASKALRQRWLAASLLARFEYRGHSPTDLDGALHALREALRIPVADTLKAALLGELGRALTARCDACETTADLGEAVQVLCEAIGLSPEGSENWVGWHLNLGAALCIGADMGADPQRYAQAIGVYRAALQRVGVDSPLWFSLYFNIASAQLALGSPNGSTNMLDEAISGLVRLRDCQLSDEQRAMVRNALGRCWRERFDIVPDDESLDIAISSLESALSLVDADSPDAARCLHHLTLALERQEAYSRDRVNAQITATYERILQTPVVQGWPRYAATAATNYGNYCMRHGDYPAARDAYEKGLTALDGIRRASAVVSEKVRYAQEHGGLYASIAECCLAMGDTAAAFGYVTAAKARAFAEDLSRAPSDEAAPNPRIATLEGEAHDTRARLEHLRGINYGERDPEVSVAGEDLTDGDRRRRTDVYTLQTREARLRQSAMTLRAKAERRPETPPEIPGLDHVQAGLAQVGAVALEFHRSVRGWGAFVVSPDTVHHVFLGETEPPWRNWAEQITVASRSANDAEVTHVFRAFHDFFVTPVRHYLPPSGRPVVCAPTGFLNVFPLGAALGPDGRHMLDDHPITTVPSSYLFATRPRARLTSILAVSHAGRAGRRDYIPFADVEASTICSAFQRATHLTGDEANRETITDLAAHHDVVHFACHGVVDWGRPDLSGLVLPHGAWLTRDDLVARRCFGGSSLVVLSACDVGVEVPLPGDEHVSLVRAFEISGAPTIVAGLWAVDDISTMLLMHRFYAHLTSTGSSSPTLCVRPRCGSVVPQRRRFLAFSPRLRMTFAHPIGNSRVSRCSAPGSR